MKCNDTEEKKRGGRVSRGPGLSSAKREKKLAARFFFVSPTLPATMDGPGAEVARTDPITLSAWLLQSQHIKAPAARGSLTILLNALCVSCKFVESAVRKVREWRGEGEKKTASAPGMEHWLFRGQRV